MNDLSELIKKGIDRNMIVFDPDSKVGVISQKFLDFIRDTMNTNNELTLIHNGAKLEINKDNKFIFIKEQENMMELYKKYDGFVYEYPKNNYNTCVIINFLDKSKENYEVLLGGY